MTKFRKWLIHKLGGYVYEITDKFVDPTSENIELETLYDRYIIEHSDMMNIDNKDYE